jgi:hypothetical protein
VSQAKDSDYSANTEEHVVECQDYLGVWSPAGCAKRPNGISVTQEDELFLINLVNSSCSPKNKCSLFTWTCRMFLRVKKS